MKYVSIRIIRCFKCHGYGHKMGDCRSALTCEKYAEHHKARTCKTDSEVC